MTGCCEVLITSLGVLGKVGSLAGARKVVKAVE